MTDATALVRIVIADDHPIFRAGLRKLLESHPRLTVAGEAGAASDAVSLVRSARPDVLLLDLAMPDGGGIAVLESVHAHRDPVKTVLLAAAVTDNDIRTALRLGARGVLLKSAATELLFECIEAVVRGEYWIGRNMVASLIEALAAHERREIPKRPFGLTERELAVVRLVVEGCSNQDIAAQLRIREDTVKHHLSHAFDKTGTSTRLELALLAVHTKLLES